TGGYAARRGGVSHLWGYAPGHHHRNLTLSLLTYLRKKSHRALRWDTIASCVVLALRAMASRFPQAVADQRNERANDGVLDIGPVADVARSGSGVEPRNTLRIESRLDPFSRPAFCRSHKATQQKWAHPRNR